MLRRRLSTLRATTVVALAAVLAAAIAVTPSLAGSPFLTNEKAAHLYVSNKKATTLFLKKKAAGNTFVKKAEAPYEPVAGIAAGTAIFNSASTTAGYIPTAFTSFGTPGVAPAVVTFSGSAICTAAKPGPDLACPIQILVDGQSTGKINFAPATAETPAPVALVHTVMQTTVLQKGGHTIAVQYAGAKNVTFTLKGWSLAVQAYPERPEESEVTSGTKGKGE